MLYKNKLLLILFLFCNCFFLKAQQENTTNKSIKVWRTSTNADEVIAFSVNTFTVAKNTEKYIHMLVNYPAQPDIAISIDADNESENGDFSKIIRPLIPYTNFGKWETLVFPISGGENGIDVNALVIYPDLGLQNETTAQVLNNSGNFAYIDDIILHNTNTLTTNVTAVHTDVFVFPNPTETIFTINSSKNINHISLYTNLGKEIKNNFVLAGKNRYDISHLSSGLYFLKLIASDGSMMIKKIIKK